MHFDYRRDAPVCESADFIPTKKLIYHRDSFMGHEASELSAFSQKSKLEKAEDIYRFASRSKSPVLREYADYAAGYTAHKYFFRSIGDGIITEKADCILKRDFGSVNEFAFLFRTEAVKNRYSGFLWLTYTRGRLFIRFTENNTLPPASHKPLLCLDLFEHSYYETYGSDRKAYAAAFLLNADWKKLDF